MKRAQPRAQAEQRGDLPRHEEDDKLPVVEHSRPQPGPAAPEAGLAAEQQGPGQHEAAAGGGSTGAGMAGVLVGECPWVRCSRDSSVTVSEATEYRSGDTAHHTPLALRHAAAEENGMNHQ